MHERNNAISNGFMIVLDEILDETEIELDLDLDVAVVKGQD
jgi:hypothetical protein